MLNKPSEHACADTRTARRPHRTVAAAVALGLVALAAHGLAFAAQADPGVTVTEPTAPVTVTSPDTDEAAAASAEEETGGASDDNRDDLGEEPDRQAVPDGAAQPQAPAYDEASGEDGDPPAETAGTDVVGVARVLDAAAAADLEGTPYGPDMTRAEETGVPVANGVSADPMEALLAVVRRQQESGSSVKVVAADPATGRVVYGPVEGA